MYDSPEVRDRVRAEMLNAASGSRLPQMSNEEMAAVRDAMTAHINQILRETNSELMARLGVTPDRLTPTMLAWNEQYQRLIEAWTKAFLEPLVEITRPFMDALAEALQPVSELMRQWGEKIGLVIELEKGASQPLRCRRTRKPDVLPVHLIDAVAAGRQPAMTQRRRIRGGRR